MFSKIEIKGLGPHEDTELVLPSPLGVTRFRGASESGKSTLALALSFCLWGESPEGSPCPVEVITDEAKHAGVRLTTRKGLGVRRSMTRRRSVSRVVSRAHGDERATSEKEWREWLGPMGEDVDLLRLISMPFSWVKPLGSGQNGKELRDLLGRLIPVQASLRDVVSELMVVQGCALRDTDPLDEKGALAFRRDARKARDEKAGALAHAKRELARLEASRVEAPGEEEIKAAKSVLDLEKAWQEYNRAQCEWEAAAERFHQAEKSAKDWDDRKRQLGKRPEPSNEIPEARSLVADLEEALAGIPAESREALEALKEAERVFAAAHAAVEDLGEGDVCPTCERDGWEAVAERRAELIAERDRARDAVSEAKKAHRKEVQAEKKRKETRDSMTQELADARKRLEEALAKGDAAAKWDDAHRYLGERPVPVVAGPAPEPPAGPRPYGDKLREAQALIERARDAEIRQSQRAESILRARAEVTDLETELMISEDGFTRAEALLECVREAPSVLARQSMGGLGDTGPVTLEMPEGSPGVEVKIDGRPWWLASKGRQVVADLYLRMAFRRALGARNGAARAMPIIVDEVQSWTGEWPEADGPIWMLETVRDLPGLEVL